MLLSHDGVAKISDFGVSYYNELLASNNIHLQLTDQVLNKIDRELAETAGTPAFFAPELCCAGDTTASTLNQQRRPRISKAIDIWALGVTLYCFIFGQCPFIAATEFELFDTIPTQPLTFPSVEQVGFEIDQDLQDLLKRLLTKNPDDRITLDQVKVCNIVYIYIYISKMYTNLVIIAPSLGNSRFTRSTSLDVKNRPTALLYTTTRYNRRYNR